MRTAFTAVLAAISLAAISFPASAEPIDHAVAGNPETIMAQVGAMHLTPLSDQDAAQVRGEFLPAAIIPMLNYIYYLGVVYGIPTAVNYAAEIGSRPWIAKQYVKDQVKKYFGW